MRQQLHFKDDQTGVNSLSLVTQLVSDRAGLHSSHMLGSISGIHEFISSSPYSQSRVLSVAFIQFYLFFSFYHALKEYYQTSKSFLPCNLYLKGKVYHFRSWVALLSFFPFFFQTGISLGYSYRISYIKWTNCCRKYISLFTCVVFCA